MSAVRQAIVLAAGEGRRLRPLTLTTPKPLVPFFGRPLLDWAIDLVVRAGATRIAVNAFHLADEVEAHVLAIAVARPDLQLHVSREPALLGTGGAVRYLKDWLTPGAPFLVANADTVLGADPRVLGDGPALLVTRESAHAREREGGETAARYRERRLIGDASGRWLALDEAGAPDGFTFCGLTLADPDLPARLPDGPSCILRQGFVPSLATRPVRLVETAAFFADTGTPEALVDAHVRGLPWVSARASPPLEG